MFFKSVEIDSELEQVVLHFLKKSLAADACIDILLQVASLLIVVHGLYEILGLTVTVCSLKVKVSTWLFLDTNRPVVYRKLPLFLFHMSLSISLKFLNTSI